MNKMKFEFLEAYNALFSDSYKRLDRSLKIKLKAMKYCQDFFDFQRRRFRRKTGISGSKIFDRITLSGPAEFTRDQEELTNQRLLSFVK